MSVFLKITVVSALVMNQREVGSGVDGLEDQRDRQEILVRIQEEAANHLKQVEGCFQDRNNLFSNRFEVKPLCATSFADVSPILQAVFFFQVFKKIISFPVQECVHLIRFHLLTFVFILLPREIELRKHWYGLCQRMFCL